MEILTTIGEAAVQAFFAFCFAIFFGLLVAVFRAVYTYYYPLIIQKLNKRNSKGYLILSGDSAVMRQAYEFNIRIMDRIQNNAQKDEQKVSIADEENTNDTGAAPRVHEEDRQ